MPVAHARLYTSCRDTPWLFTAATGHAATRRYSFVSLAGVQSAGAYVPSNQSHVVIRQGVPNPSKHIPHQSPGEAEPRLRRHQDTWIPRLARLRLSQQCLPEADDSIKDQRPGYRDKNRNGRTGVQYRGKLLLTLIEQEDRKRR